MVPQKGLMASNNQKNLILFQMALSIPSTVGSKVKSVTAPSSGASVATKPNVSRYDTRGSPVNSASSLLAGAAAAALNPGNRHATRRAALIEGPTAPVVKSSMQYPVVSRVPTRPGKPGKPGKMRVHLENLEISWNFEKFNKYHGKMT